MLRPRRFVGSAEEAVGTARQEADFATSALDVRIVSDWKRTELAPLIITAVPSFDGLGDALVGRATEADAQRVFHGGDTWMGCRSGCASLRRDA